MADTGFSSSSSQPQGSSGLPGGSQRRLHEPVMSSAEDEMSLDMPSLDSGNTDTAGEEAAPIYGSSSSRPAWWMRMEDNVSRYVSEQPGRAALMALGAGALAAALLGRGMRGRGRKD